MNNKLSLSFRRKIMIILHFVNYAVHLEVFTAKAVIAKTIFIVMKITKQLIHVNKLK